MTYLKGFLQLRTILEAMHGTNDKDTFLSWKGLEHIGWTRAVLIELFKKLKARVPVIQLTEDGVIIPPGMEKVVVDNLQDLHEERPSTRAFLGGIKDLISGLSRLASDSPLEVPAEDEPEYCLSGIRPWWEVKLSLLQHLTPVYNLLNDSSISFGIQVKRSDSSVDLLASMIKDFQEYRQYLEAEISGPSGRLVQKYIDSIKKILSIIDKTVRGEIIGFIEINYLNTFFQNVRDDMLIRKLALIPADVIKKSPKEYGEKCQFLASRAYVSRQYDEGIAILSRLISIVPQNMNAWSMLATIYGRKGDSYMVNEVYRLMKDVKPPEDFIWTRKGFELLRAGDKELAIEAFKKALVEHNDVYWAGAQLESLFDNEANYSGLIWLQDYIIKVHGDNPVSCYFKGVCLHRLGQISEAERILKHALELNPREDRALVELAKIAVNRNDVHLARNYATRAMEINKENQNAQRILESLGSRDGLITKK